MKTICLEMVWTATGEVESFTYRGTPENVLAWLSGVLGPSFEDSGFNVVRMIVL